MKKQLLLLTMACLSLGTFAQSWQWAKSSNGGGYDFGNSVCTDANGNVYATGYFQSSPIDFGGNSLTNAGQEDIYLVKYDPSGNIIWAKSAGGSSADLGVNVTTDAAGNAYITGYFQSPTLVFGSTTLTNNGGSDYFIAKYSPAGNVLWAKSAGSPSPDLGTSLTTDAAGNVYATGCFSGPSITFGSTTLSNSGAYDIFLVKYDAAGNIKWAKKAGNTADEVVNSISSDNSSNIFITGYFVSATVTFGSTVLTNNSSGMRNIFVVKYDSTGTVTWAKSAGGTYYDVADCIAADANGNAYITGTFSSSSITFGATTLNNTGSDDFYVAKYSPSGTVIWAKGATGTSYDNGRSITTDLSGNVFVTGAFLSPTITFGATPPLTVAGGNDIFVVKYDASGTILWAQSAGSSSYEGGYGISTDSSSNAYITGGFQSTSITFGPSIVTNSGSSSIYVAKIGNSTIGINNFTASFKAVNIFPNPFSGETTMRINYPGNFSGAKLWIYDVMGNEVKHISGINSSEIKIERGNLIDGLYFYTLTNDGNIIASGKLIAE